MPKNLSGGNKTKKYGNKKCNRKTIIADILDEEQLFGIIIKKFGSYRYAVLCSDQIERIGKACNKMINGCKGEYRLEIGVYVVITLRECDTQKNKCDIIGFGDPCDNIKKNLKLTVDHQKDDCIIFDKNIKNDEKYEKCVNDEENVNEIDFDDI